MARSAAICWNEHYILKTINGKHTLNMLFRYLSSACDVMKGVTPLMKIKNLEMVSFAYFRHVIWNNHGGA